MGVSGWVRWGVCGLGVGRIDARPRRRQPNQSHQTRWAPQKNKPQHPEAQRLTDATLARTSAGKPEPSSFLLGAAVSAMACSLRAQQQEAGINLLRRSDGWWASGHLCGPRTDAVAVAVVGVGVTPASPHDDSLRPIPAPNPPSVPSQDTHLMRTQRLRLASHAPAAASAVRRRAAFGCCVRLGEAATRRPPVTRGPVGVEPRSPPFG